MTFEQFYRILIKHWRLVVICSLFVGLGAFFGSKQMTPLYQSSALVEIVFIPGNTQSNYDSLLAGQQLAQTEAPLATSNPVLREVASHYRGLTVEQLAGEVTATATTSTQLVEIDVKDPSPTRAAALANDVAATLIKQQLQVFQQTLGPTGQGSVSLFIAQPAQPALSPFQPNVRLNTAAGLVTGVLLGILLAVLFELLDKRIRTPEALSVLLDWPVLGRIWQAAPTEDVINPIGHNSNVESYSILRTNIGFAALDRSLHTLVVTSGAPRDGKSVVAANLAIFMAKAGRNTLLIDADLRHPVQHEQFGIPAHALGFSNAILAFSSPTTANAPDNQQVPTPTTRTGPSSRPAVTRELSLDPFVRAVNIPHLCVMPSGPLPPNPPELLDSKAMQRFFAALSNCGAEVVIFDSPHLLGLSDASILASKVDGTLVVVDITRASKGNLLQVKALLGQAGARVLGCVVNKQHRQRKDMLYKKIPYSNNYGSRKRSDRSNYSAENTNLSTVSTVPLAISKQPETLFQPDQDEQNDGANHDASNINPPAVPANISETNDQTIQMPLIGRRKGKQDGDDR
jgi:capsular polysaccharide biosynthesis protein/MinD-like ATPase involved in chromosome partitioning or flagellar assembly